MSDLRHDEATDTPGADGLARPLDEDRSDSAGAVGERVSAILRAAEEAAEQIRADAQRLSDQLLQEARKTAEAKIAELTNDAEQSRREADDYARDMRMAVEA